MLIDCWRARLMVDTRSLVVLRTALLRAVVWNAGMATAANMAAMTMATISSSSVNPLTRVIRHPPFSACTICWPSDKMEFIAMTGCLSGTNRHFGTFYCDFKGVSGEGRFAPGAGAPTVTGGVRFCGGGTAGARDRPVRRGGH